MIYTSNYHVLISEVVAGLFLHVPLDQFWEPQMDTLAGAFGNQTWPGKSTIDSVWTGKSFVNSVLMGKPTL